MIRRTFLGLDVARHPVLAGLVWAALFVPAACIVSALLRQPVPAAKLSKLVLLAIPAGLAWGFGMKIYAARQRDA